MIEAPAECHACGYHGYLPGGPWYRHWQPTQVLGWFARLCRRRAAPARLQLTCLRCNCRLEIPDDR